MQHTDYTPIPLTRLIFALDATASRQSLWDRAKDIQGEMFHATERFGGLQVQLCYYRGKSLFTAGPWVHDANALHTAMASVTCEGGYTQLETLLHHALREHASTPIKAIVFVGDAVEEDVDALCHIARELRHQQLPLYAFQEGNDPFAAAALRQMARLSGGVHLQFNQQSPHRLAQLLGAVAAWATGDELALTAYVSTANASNAYGQRSLSPGVPPSVASPGNPIHVWQDHPPPEGNA